MRVENLTTTIVGASGSGGSAVVSKMAESIRSVSTGALSGIPSERISDGIRQMNDLPSYAVSETKTTQSPSAGGVSQNHDKGQGR